MWWNNPGDMHGWVLLLLPDVNWNGLDKCSGSEIDDGMVEVMSQENGVEERINNNVLSRVNGANALENEENLIWVNRTYYKFQKSFCRKETSIRQYSVV